MKLDMTLLTVILVLLKVTGIVSWSWWVVLLPIWLPLAFLGGILVLLMGFFILAAIAQAL